MGFKDGRRLVYYYHVLRFEAIKKIFRFFYGVFLRAKIYILSRFYRMFGYRNVHFIHIRKTGGTAIKNALRGINKTSRRYKIWLHPHRVSLKYIPRGDYIVIFVRDPISRFISGFYSRLREGRPANYFPWTPGEREAFKYFKTPDQLGKALKSRDRDIRMKALKAMRDILHVNTFLTDWLISEDYLYRRLDDILFIGLQENLEEDFEILKRILGIPEKISLPKDPRLSHRSPVNEDRNLSSEALEALREWYGEDIKIYNFLIKVRRNILSKIREGFDKM